MSGFFVIGVVPMIDPLSCVPVGILRYNGDVTEPVMLVQACELNSFGFFQRGT